MTSQLQLIGSKIHAHLKTMLLALDHQVELGKRVLALCTPLVQAMQLQRHCKEKTGLVRWETGELVAQMLRR